jgi:hypothetical protein
MLLFRLYRMLRATHVVGGDGDQSAVVQLNQHIIGIKIVTLTVFLLASLFRRYAASLSGANLSFKPTAFRMEAKLSSLGFPCSESI